MPSPVDTIVAPATPRGTSALALLRASGSLVPELARAIFGETELQPRTATHLPYFSGAGDRLDEVVVTRFVAPASYTGEDLLEISTHGNPLIVQAVVSDLISRGCRLAEPGEFTRRAFLNGRLDLTQAEAVMDVIHARSDAALRAAQTQLQGALGEVLGKVSQQLIAALAQVEAYIDFPDDDLPPENRAALLEDVRATWQRTGRLLATQRYGDVLRHGLRTVILGEPNVGKSSLLNALVGHERALVSPEPGTTRDYLEESLSVGGHWLRLIDTAGLNPKPGEIERQGIERTIDRLRQADLVLLVLDVTAPSPALSPSVRELLPVDRTLVILNKWDTVKAGRNPASPFPALPHYQTSALTGAGLDDLIGGITEAAERLNPALGDEILAINARHADALARARTLLELAESQLVQGAPAELLASNLRLALDAVGEIAGRIDHEEVLDQLFATFCIGK